MEKLTAEPEESKCSNQDADHLRKPEDVSSSQQANDRAIQPQSDSAEIVGGEIEVADWHMGYFQNYLASLEDLGAVGLLNVPVRSRSHRLALECLKVLKNICWHTQSPILSPHLRSLYLHNDKQ